jgi:glutathione peroxidase
VRRLYSSHCSQIRTLAQKLIMRLICLFFLIATISYAQTTAMGNSIHAFTVDDINGNSFELSSLRGKKVMIVNTASKCGLTPQYEKLEALYQQYKDQNFVIIGFPANNFMWQEPGTNDEIKAFCQKNYGVSFPMMAKISVKGRKQHPLYAFLTQKAKNGVVDSSVKWNFQKYLIDENGVLVDVIAPRTQPDDIKILTWIKG